MDVLIKAAELARQAGEELQLSENEQVALFKAACAHGRRLAAEPGMEKQAVPALLAFLGGALSVGVPILARAGQGAVESVGKVLSSAIPVAAAAPLLAGGAGYLLGPPIGRFVAGQTDPDDVARALLIRELRKQRRRVAKDTLHALLKELRNKPQRVRTRVFLS